MTEDTTNPEVVAATPEAPVSEQTGRQPTHIVGIGASAGGLEALERFFEQMPDQTDLAFVVVQHLSPDFKSLTNELLARRTSIPIHQVQDGMAVESDAIYLLPPKKDMIISNGRLLLSDKDPVQVVALPIDYFFRSLAQDAGDRAVAVILSGTGSDGSRGIRDVHEAGGLIVVQAPDSAKFDGMPKSALKTGVVDVTATPEEMPQALLKYAKHPLAASAGVPTPEPVPEGGMNAVFHLLRDAYDIDFAHYKPSTVGRRIERRLLLCGVSSLDQYVETLRRDSEELNALYKDLLIGVTRFFRDREAYDAFSRTVLPGLLQQVSHENEFRVWVAGCATGEEAYSIAILIAEQLELRQKRLLVRIFATDVHRHSLEVASAGVYPESSLSDVSPQRVQRYFIRKGDSYAVAPELRKMVVFAQHNVIKDAPFTKIDVITCRNLLIYFQPGTQKKVLSLFHFGLRTGGVLFLGPSESPGELEDEFEVLDGHWRIHRKRRDIRLPAELRVGGVGFSRTTMVPTPPSPPGVLESQLGGAYDALLEAFMPPSVLVTESRQVIQTFADANRYLRFKSGRFSNDILDMVDAELHMALTGALPRALKDMRPMVYKGVRVGLTEGERLVNVTVRPIEDRKARAVHALISLEDTGPVAAPQSPEEVALGDASREQVQSLETELRYTKENLQATIEELETSNEELQATNEELVASNEELQSTNEELHSVNEELYTVNGEYQRKIAELTELTADMDNLLASTDVHTVFLDRKLCIRKFTPKIGETFNLMPQDVGRRIDNFTHNIEHPGLLEDLRSVLETSAPVERQVRDHAGRSYLLRSLPYRSGSTMDGVVLTLIDITSLRRAQAEVNRTQEQLTSILRNSPSLVSIKDLDGRFLLVGDSLRRLLGRDDLIGKTAFDLFPQETGRALLEQSQRVRREGTVAEAEITIPHADGPHTYWSVKFPLREESGQVYAVGNIMTDVTRLKEAEHNAREAVHQRDRFLAMLSHELRNPLTATVNSLALLERRSEPLPEEADRSFQVIRRRVRHMARLLDDLLDVARIAQNKIGIRKQVLDLAGTVAGALEEVRAAFDERKVNLNVDPVPGPLPVCGDPARLQQLQVNILLNAAKYTPSGGSAWYSVRREGNEVVIRVRDSGVGMSADMLERVFDLFVQVNREADPTNGGMGVGLSLVRSIVTMHGGRVQAYSDGPGRGSEFVVWLPLAREELPSESSPRTGCDGVAESGRASRLLIVEDDDDNRNSLRVLLEMDGFEVTAVADGRAALEALQKVRADIAVIDLGLPGMDGCEVARRIRQRYGRDGIRLAALTGFGQASDRELTQAAGFDVHLTKPLEPDELYRVLHAMRDGRAVVESM